MKRLHLVLALLASAPSMAHADALPFEQEARLGSPARAVRVRVDAGSVSLRAGAQTHQTSLPIAAVDATLELVEVSPGHHVAVVRASGSGGELAAAIAVVSGGRATVLWTGRLDLHGDPGERTADVLSLDDRTGDGHPNVVVGTQREDATLCGERATLLYPRAYDPSRGGMRPVALRRLPADGPEVTVTATRESPGPTGPPLLQALRFTGASSTAGRGEDVTGLAPPRALSDGDPATFWAEGRGGPGSGEFVVARYDARMPIVAVAVTATSGTAGAALGRPRRFWLAGDAGPRVRVTMPDDPGLHAGERYWIRLPEPLSWRCVALVLDEAYSPAGTSDAAVHTGLAEVELYTELDFGRGLDALVAVLIEGRDGGDEAARLLSGLGSPAVRGVAQAWERLDALGRRRAVRVFAEGARRGAGEGIPALAIAGEDADETVRTAALEALGTLGAPAALALSELVRAPAPVGDAALRPFSRHEPALVVPALLAALSADGGSERSALREALASSLARADEEARRTFEAWLLAEPPVGPRAAAALGLASHVRTRPLAGPLVGATMASAETFEDRWRLVQAARELPAEAEVDAWLASVATGAAEWMLRAAAISALASRDSDRRVEVARAALADDYPRVRVEAVRVLDLADADDDQLARLARQDSWPLVREAATNALWNRDTQRDVVRASVRDRSPRVRRAAIAGLARAGDRQAWPLIRARLMDDDEWPEVTVAALAYVRDLCIAEAGEALVVVMQRALAPSAWQPHVEVAVVAADLALVLGGPAAEHARQLESRPDAPAAMRAVIQQRIANPGRCTR